MLDKFQRSIIALVVITALSYLLKYNEWFFNRNSNSNILDTRKIEPFNNHGHSQAHEMCLKMAGDNCRIPTYPNNECWMSVYNRCRNMCSRDIQGDCECDQVANSECVSGNEPANACLRTTYQKCMAGRVAGIPDPDRGFPSI